MKIFALIGLLVVVLLGSSILWSRSSQTSEPGIVSQNGLHWHPQLEIYVAGQKVEIPQNIGVGSAYSSSPGFGNGGMAMTPIHTHDDLPVIHLEFSGVVREEDVTLGNFFKVWQRDMRSLGQNMRMTVNGMESNKTENYVMHDGDRIVLNYD